MNKLSSNVGEVTEVVSEEIYAKLLRISIEYYSHIKSYDEQVLIKKKFYISALFSNSLNIKLKAAENNYILLDTKIKNKKSRFDGVFENISTIIKKYD